ncbi:MAG TPA: maleylpyruvate isomerase N-terminal domain-containing protein [Acidimicrobiales bacterium]|nr:maleylpyruvate isomerase N-terminal domain-containing protein [Acidimicrobiales bacterium]
MNDHLPILRRSTLRLADVASRLSSVRYRERAYPREWSIADTFSHLGSGAVIGQRRFEDEVAGREGDPLFNQTVWDAWNAKDPVAQVHDALASDAALVAALENATNDERRAFHFQMGPFSFDFSGFVGLRLGEHVLHTWDVEVVLDPSATLPNDAANAILDHVQFVVQRTGQSLGEAKELRLRTLEPVRDFTLVADGTAVNLVPASHHEAIDLELSAEALVRAIYGRLDDEHCPPELHGPALETLRHTFPGF